MRLHLKLTKSTKTVPFDYQHMLLGVFHKWLGDNAIHDSISLYSIGWLSGSKTSKTGFDFNEGASWFISFIDLSMAEKLIVSIRKSPEMFNGMHISEIIIQEDPMFSSEERFVLDSPVFLRKYTEGKENKRAIHLRHDDPDADALLTATLKNKLKTAGLDYEVEVKFDRTYQNAKTKLVTIKNIKSKANFCPVIVKGDPRAVAFAWNVGIGHSTGSGFGALK